MNDMTGSHVPRPEFRAMLEGEVVRTFRRESQFAKSRMIPARRLRALSLVMVGLVMGFTTEFASGQVQDNRERNRLLETAEANRQLAALRLRLAEEELVEVRKRVDSGIDRREALLQSESAVREMQLRIARIDLEVAEIRVSAAPARDELSAPVIGGRDFVSDRLKVDAAVVQDRLRTAEARLDEVQRSYRVGVSSSGVLADAEAQVEDVKRQLELLATKLAVRKQFLERAITSEDAERRVQRFEIVNEIRRATTELRRARTRVETAREQARVGAASELDAKRAEVDLLEVSKKLKQLELQLRELDALRKDPP